MRRTKFKASPNGCIPVVGTTNLDACPVKYCPNLELDTSHQQAVCLMEELPKGDRSTWMLIDAAESNFTLGNLSKCRQYSQEVTQAIRDLENSKRQAKRK